MVGARPFFRKVLISAPGRDEIPYPKKADSPPYLSGVGRGSRHLIDAVDRLLPHHPHDPLWHGRRAECAAVKLTDIDSARMVVHVQDGKGGKDRDIVLSPNRRPRPGQPGAGRNLPVGLFLAAAGTPPITPSATRSSGTPVGNPPACCSEAAASAHSSTLCRVPALFRGAMESGHEMPVESWVSAHPRAPSPGIVWSQGHVYVADILGTPPLAPVDGAGRQAIRRLLGETMKSPATLAALLEKLSA